MQKGRVKESTYVKYDGIIMQHIIPKLGGCLPLAMNTQLAEGFKLKSNAIPSQSGKYAHFYVLFITMGCYGIRHR